MKLRIEDNGIRLRLRKSDLDTLAGSRTVIGSVAFLTKATFIFELSISNSINEVEAILTKHKIQVLLPETKANKWIESKQVGIEKYITLEDGSKLKVLVEKDFPCLDRENENKDDTFWELVPD